MDILHPLRQRYAYDIGGSNSRTPAIKDRVWQQVFKLGFPIALFLSRFQKRQYLGTLIVIRVGNSVLLLRSSYRREWNLPGGRQKVGESAEAAVRRELSEETGISVGQILATKTISGVWHGRAEKISFFEARIDILPAIRIDNREIIEWKLVPTAELSNWSITGPVKDYFASVFDCQVGRH